MIRAIVFDCFGVLISDALEVMVADVRETKPELAEQIVNILHAASKGHIVRQESTAMVAQLLEMSVEEYLARIKNGEVKNQQLLDYILRIRKNYKTGLLSNVSIGGLAARFEADELEKYFDVVVASGDIGYAKPESQAYEITADKLGVRLEECVFIDDREDYCEGARHVGMRAVLYKSFEQMKRELESLNST